MPDLTDELLGAYPLISDQVDAKELRVILRELQAALATSPYGAIVEFGCYTGTTSLFIQRVIDRIGGAVDFHVYDSFEGLPPKTSEDLSPAGEQFQAGELSASRKEFIRQFKKAGLRVPIIHKAWFSELSPRDIPTRISFAYLDGDYYESIRDSLRLVWPVLLEGGRVTVDDYANEALPGARRAVDEWCGVRGIEVRVEASIAYFVKPRS